MNYQLNPSAHPWLHKLACLYKPYETAVHHSMTTYPLPLDECDLCLNEYRAYVVSSGKTVEAFGAWYQQVYVPKQKAKEAASNAATPVPHSRMTCPKALAECEQCMAETQAYYESMGKNVEDYLRA